MALKLLLFFLLALVSLSHPVGSSTVTTIRRKSKARTDVKAEHLTYEWTINDFTLLPQEKGQYIESPEFHTANNDAGWKLRLYPQGYNDENYMSLYLHLAYQSLGRMRIHWKILIIKCDEVKVDKTYEDVYDRPRLFGDPQFLNRSDLINMTSPEDTFIIRAEIDMPMKTATVPISITESLKEEMEHDLAKYRWTEHFARLFKEPKFSDVVVIASNERFFAHKVILATRSPVFAAMFEDNRTNEVRIEHIAPVGVEAMLEFIYTDEVTDLDRRANILLEAAYKFQLPRLKTMCEMVIYKALKASNAADLLILTHESHSSKLKDHVMNFIVDHFSEVMISKSYERMEEYPELLTELFHSALLKNEPKTEKK
ncbi:speckle-type POZ protein A [Diachasma alloeum]|uniref:speckle-type POZ protein A n=1 Tax=Diachasma alloeum TaxID=454923 RepID=UPI00073827CF|nr:speckle-type POZ protein A [Diachasma alloeum]